MIGEPYLGINDKLFILRDIVIKLMLAIHEEADIYVFMSKDKLEIIYLHFSPNCECLNLEKCIRYKTTLKKLYLYLIISAHPNISIESLIIYANRIIRRLSTKEVAKLMAISELEYLNLETGITTNIDLEKVAFMMNFKKEEFYFNFKTTFEKL